MKLSARSIIVLTCGLLLLLIALMPMRFALGLAGKPVNAARAAGFVWAGAIGDLSVGKLRLGNVEAGLKPLPLLVGRRSFWIQRISGPAIQPLAGTFTMNHGVEQLDGSVDISSLFPMLPLSTADFEGFSVQFDGKSCKSASGRLRIAISGGGLPGVDLRSGLLGTARCEDGKLLIPLASQSAMERVDLQLDGDGRYAMTMTVSNDDPQLAAALTLVGFQSVSGGYRLVRRGEL